MCEPQSSSEIPTGDEVSPEIVWFCPNNATDGVQNKLHNSVTVMTDTTL